MFPIFRKGDLSYERSISSNDFRCSALSLMCHRIGAESVSLTFVTGTLSRIGGHLAAAAGRKSLPDGDGTGDSHLARARMDASVWSGFLVGAALSGITGSHSRTWALLPAVAVMIALVLLSEPGTGEPKKAISATSAGRCVSG